MERVDIMKRLMPRPCGRGPLAKAEVSILNPGPLARAVTCILACLYKLSRRQTQIWSLSVGPKVKGPPVSRHSMSSGTQAERLGFGFLVRPGPLAFTNLTQETPFR